MPFLGILALAAAMAAAPRAEIHKHAYLSDREAARILDQATWGPTPAAIEELQHKGPYGWLNDQFSLNTSDLPDQPPKDSAGNTNTDLRPVQLAFFRNAVAGRDQLRQRVAFALSQIWVVSTVSGVSDAYAYPPYWRLFRDSAFGNYRDLIRAVTLNPAMGRYLNMANNNKANASKGTAANENYARELMQLFTLGLVQLNQDGSQVLDSKGSPIPTYDQTAVTEVARALTGWTYPTAPGAVAQTNNPAYYIGQMFAVEGQHDTGSKTFLGTTLPAGQTAARDLEGVIDALMMQDTMAPFVCRQLIQHLVTSNPSPAFVARVSRVFLDDGLGVRGDLKAVVTAILMDQEAREADAPAPAESASYGHLREPVLFITNLLRGLNVTLADTSTVYSQPANLGQDVFKAPSVFSYFSSSYRTPGGAPGPEFQIYSTQTAIARANIVNTALYGTLDKGTTLDLSPFVQRASNPNTLIDYIGAVFLHSLMPSALRQAALDAAAAASTATAKAQAALYVVLTSAEYQVLQ